MRTFALFKFQTNLNFEMVRQAEDRIDILEITFEINKSIILLVCQKSFIFLVAMKKSRTIFSELNDCMLCTIR